MMDKAAHALAMGPVSWFESVTAQCRLEKLAGHGMDCVQNAQTIVYVLRGSVELCVPSGSVRAASNELLLLPCLNNGELVYDFSADSEWYVIHFRQSERKSPELRSLFGSVVHVRAGRPERITALLRQCIGYQGRRTWDDYAASHFVRLIMAEGNLSNPESAQPPEGQGVFEVITSTVDAYIAAHFHEPISTVEIAREVRYNPEYLERAYRQVRQVSIREAILDRRLNEVRAQLLLQKNRNVADIAFDCGFNDLSYFRRAFKNMTNMTPHGYRTARRGDRDAVDTNRDKVHATALRTVGLRRDGVRFHESRPGPVHEEDRGAIEAMNGGFFVSSGYGTHARRTIESYELIFVTEGCLELFEGETSYRVRKNQSLLLVPGRVHGGLSPFAPDLNFYWIHFRVREPLDRGSVMYIPKTVQVSDPEFLAELFCMFISDQESEKLTKDSAADLVALMLNVMGEAKGAPSRKQVRGQPNVLAQQIDKFIDENYSRPISTRTIAEELQFNPDYLERVNREYAGTSIVHALHERRIRAAREHLRNRVSKNIDEIAFACGYNDSGYFRRVFKRVTGLTPKQYRSMFVQTHINTH